MADSRFQRVTPQRRVILEELRKLTSHPTAAGLYAIVRRRMPRISLGTVYRNLELMAEMGMIRKLPFGGGEARYDGDLTRHHHVRCLRCGRVDDVDRLPLDLTIGQGEDLGEYQVVGYHLELLGVCGACRKKNASANHSQEKREC